MHRQAEQGQPRPADALATSSAAEGPAWEQPRELSPLVTVVTAKNPSPLTLTGTNTYVLKAGPLVIDPGPADPIHLDAVVRAAQGRPVAVLLTHAHPDHAEGARELARALGAPILGPARASPDRALQDGENPIPGTPLKVLATPGHSPDHLCFLLEPETAVFTGDHILGSGTSLVDWPEGDMEAYLSSLRRLLALAPRRLYPGHGPVVEHPLPWINWYIRHRQAREAQILAALAAGLTRPSELLKHVYADVDPVLHPAAELTLRAHLESLEKKGLVKREADGWRCSLPDF